MDSTFSLEGAGPGLERVLHMEEDTGHEINPETSTTRTFPGEALGQRGEFSPGSTRFVLKPDPQGSFSLLCLDLAEPALHAAGFGCLGWEIAVSVNNSSIVPWERQSI